MFHTGVRELHRAIVEGRRSRLIVNVDDATPLVRQSLELTNPQLAEAIPDDALDVLVGISQSTPLDTTMRISSLAGWLIAPVRRPRRRVLRRRRAKRRRPPSGASR